MEIVSRLSASLGKRLLDCECIGGGRNSRVYKVTLETGETYAAKVYFQNPHDRRDRMATEFRALHFLWEKGIRCIPAPVSSDPAIPCAVFEFVNGSRILSENVGGSEVGQAVQFLLRLRQLSRTQEARELPAASEACFSVEQLVNNLLSRLQRLEMIRQSGPGYAALTIFLEQHFRPALRRLVPWSQSALNRAVLSFTADLAWEDRTLSPSDFGFHNALRREPDGIVFLDFEYFGWDDPAKMICDFLLHPAMNLEDHLRERFLVEMIDGFFDTPWLRPRVEAVYPLFVLKWCLILLNEFVPSDLSRRRFSSIVPADESTWQLLQLEKARRMLERVQGECETFICKR
ncbi:MAG: hypothetical protein HY645_08375 [Acidobacteria bacterium]|nr:hypothetical protein [Acidobacteriota bacterium]